MRYIVVKDDIIHQILTKQPLFVPEDMNVLSYDGNIPDDKLCIINGEIHDKRHFIEKREANVEQRPVERQTSVEEYREQQYLLIEKTIEKIRLKYISSFIGQNEVYLEKIQEAVDFAATNFSSSIDNFPFIALECELTGKTGKEIALEIIEKRKQWLNIALKTEKIRKLTKKRLQACKTKREINKIVNETLSELSQIS